MSDLVPRINKTAIASVLTASRVGVHAGTLRHFFCAELKKEPEPEPEPEPENEVRRWRQSAYIVASGTPSAHELTGLTHQLD